MRNWICLALLGVALAGCGDDAPPPQTVFAPLTYAYLRPLRLNVAAIDIQTDWAPGPADLSAQSPTVPVQALRQMAQDRLLAAGASGRAVFTVQQASILPHGDNLDGLLKVRLDVYTSDNRRAAFAEAAVARSATGPQREADMPAALYSLTRQMMADMNVEFEFQLRRSLGDWVQAGAGAAPPPAAVQQQDLAPPPGSTTLAPGTLPAQSGSGQTPASPTRYQLVPSPPPGR